MQNATLCYWQGVSDQTWSKVTGFSGDDGSSDMLALLVCGPVEYVEWAESHYECIVQQEAAAALFSHEPLTDSLILVLNPEADLKAAYSDAEEISYPIAA
ncbi:hypothetical protein HKW97_25010 (plasmid) [Pseudomonas luteola]|uniref:hypothetical protein n=1 Tax=Pseudomonas luteola TaxID=47886 RepID=UPI00388F5CB7